MVNFEKVESPSRLFWLLQASALLYQFLFFYLIVEPSLGIELGQMPDDGHFKSCRVFLGILHLLLVYLYVLLKSALNFFLKF